MLLNQEQDTVDLVLDVNVAQHVVFFPDFVMILAV